MDFNISVKMETVDDSQKELLLEHDLENSIKERVHVAVKIEPLELQSATDGVALDHIGDSSLYVDAQIKEEMEIGPTVLQRSGFGVHCQYADEMDNPSEEHLTQLKHRNSKNKLLKRHRKSPKIDSDTEIKLENKMTVCKICSKTFTRAANYNRHMKEFHDENSVFTCEKCKKLFRRQYALLRHQRSKVRCIVDNIENIFKCPCGKKFKSKSNYHRHRTGYCDSTRVGVYICDICRKAFPNRVRLSVHLSHHKRVKSKCINNLQETGEEKTDPSFI